MDVRFWRLMSVPALKGLISRGQQRRGQQRQIGNRLTLLANLFMGHISLTAKRTIYHVTLHTIKHDSLWWMIFIPFGLVVEYNVLSSYYHLYHLIQIDTGVVHCVRTAPHICTQKTSRWSRRLMQLKPETYLELPFYVIIIFLVLVINVKDHKHNRINLFVWGIGRYWKMLNDFIICHFKIS